MVIVNQLMVFMGRWGFVLALAVFWPSMFALSVSGPANVLVTDSATIVGYAVQDYNVDLGYDALFFGPVQAGFTQQPSELKIRIPNDLSTLENTTYYVTLRVTSGADVVEKPIRITFQAPSEMPPVLNPDQNGTGDSNSDPNQSNGFDSNAIVSGLTGFVSNGVDSIRQWNNLELAIKIILAIGVLILAIAFFSRLSNRLRGKAK